jgi:hypothetical protein
MRACLLLVPLLCAAACIRVERNATGTVGGLPEVILGAWHGNWTSAVPSGATTTGWISMRLQRFGNLPVIRIESDNPCLQPEVYRLEVTERRLQLTGTAAVFTGEFAPDWRSLEGAYSCGVDRGTWRSVWTRAMDPAGDLTGAWLGSYEVDPPASGGGPFTLTLRQEWVQGTLQVRGTVTVPPLTPDLMVIAGEVHWDAGGFQVQLLTDPARAPFVVLTGQGDARRMVVSPGRFLVGTPPGNLLGSGSWDAFWAGR